MFSRILYVSGIAFAALAGYAVPRPEALVTVASDVTSKTAPECPKVDATEAERLRRQVEALEKDLALRDERLKKPAGAPPAAAKADQAVAAARPERGWGKKPGDDEAIWSIPKEDFQPW